jgi:bifunctional non-homologous end joining protein LigD
MLRAAIVKPVPCRRASIRTRSACSSPSRARDAFTRDGWVFELKLDGYRLIASKSRGEALLLTRNGNDYTEVFPESRARDQALPYDNCIVDGGSGRARRRGQAEFFAAAEAGRLSSPLEIRNSAIEHPATFYAFDLLVLDDLDLRPLPLTTRKEIPHGGRAEARRPARARSHRARRRAFLAQVAALKLEGMIAKKADAPYRAGRSELLVQDQSRTDGGFRHRRIHGAEGSRASLGALQLADMVVTATDVRGRVGTGFNDALLTELGNAFAPIVRADPPCDPPSAAGAKQIPETEDDDVDRADVRVRGPLSRVDA